MANQCPIPPYVDPCPPRRVYQVGGSEYVALKLCDTGNQQSILAVYQMCDGVVSGAPTYFDLAGAPYTPVGTVGECGSGVDYEILCDLGTTPKSRVLALWDSSAAPPTLSYFVPAADGSLTPYTPVGPVGACPETDVEESQICFVSLVAGAGYAAGDQLLQILFWDTSESPPTLTATIWRNQTQNTILAAAPPIADLSSCSRDVEDTIHCYQALVDGALGAGYTAGDILNQILWWDTSNQPPVLTSTVWRNQTTNAILANAPVFTDLAPCAEVAARDCNISGDAALSRTACVGGPVPPAVLTALSPLSVNTDDPTFDDLCSDSVSVSPETYPAPFPVNEPLRNSTSGMTLFNGATLTASAAGGNVDPPGAGWLRLTNNGFTQRGGAIINTPFPSTTAIEFEYTYAVYGPQGIGGADGHSFMLLDGNQPLPGAMGGDGGALGYASNNAQGGIAGGVIGIGLDEFGNFSNPGAGVTGTGPGFRPQNLAIRGAGNGGNAFAAPGQYPFLVGVDLPATVGQDIDGHPRNAPVKVRGSLAPNGGQMTLNLFMDFGVGYVQVANNLIINQALPTQLRIGFSASTGGGTNFHEIRDVVIAPASRRHWRAITPTFAVAPACATAGNFCVTVEYTITSDTQTAQGGDNDNEHFIGLAVEDPVGTYTWLEQRWVRSAPTDVGAKQTRTLCANGVLPANFANLRLVLGAETVDLRGSYGVRFDSVTTELTATGCPGATVKTIPISAPCPLPIVITGSGSGVSATVNTIDFDVVCSDLGQLFRQVVYDTSGVPKTTFIGQNGNVVSPTTWTPGACAGGGESIVLCDDNGSFLRQWVTDAVGAIVPRDTELDGSTAYTTVGTVRNCTAQIEIVCRCDDTTGSGVGDTAYREIISIDAAGNVTLLATYNRTFTAPYTPVNPVDCSVLGDNLNRVIPRYMVLQGAGLWTLNTDSAIPTIAVTFVAIKVGDLNSPPTVTDVGGTNPLFEGQAANWGSIYSRDVLGLIAPLILTTNAGDICAVQWVEESV